MASHDTALVSVEAWCFASPDVRASGRQVDLGVLAEALIYYDRVYFHTGNPEQFAELLSLLVRTESLDAFLTAVERGDLWFYDYAFLSAAIKKGAEFSLWNIQDPVQAAYGTWPRRFLYHSSVEAVIPHARRRQRLYRAFTDRVYEAKADDFGKAIANAREDFADARRNSIVVQAFVDELYHLRNLGRPPEVRAVVAEKHDGSGHQVTWNVNFADLSRLAGPELGFHDGTALTASAVCNRLLQSASDKRWDLFMSPPMSALLGDKLYETVKSPVRSTLNLERLKVDVEFPDIRVLVNGGKMTFQQAIEIRGKAKRFREWLQTEADRDRDAIVAYHAEVGKQTGLAGVAPRALHFFGVVGGGALGGAIGNAMAGAAGGALGGAAGAGLGYVADLGASVAAGWKPVVFGRWLERRIAEYVDENVARRGA